MKSSSIVLAFASLYKSVVAFAPSSSSVERCSRDRHVTQAHNRREFLSSSAAATALVGCILPQVARAEVDTEDFLKTGMVAMPMGVSGQAGKAKPKTGVVLREGSDVLQSKKGDVTAEILVGQDNLTPALASFSSPWPLAKGGLFDVECREASSGDGAFLTVAKATSSSIGDLPKTFFSENLFSSTGRFSFYGAPTDIKVKKSNVEGAYRYLEISFANLSQSTNAEIPRTALVVATIPEGTQDVVMLVGSSTSNRWKKGSEKAVRSTVESFRVSLAPTSGLKVRAKQAS